MTDTELERAIRKLVDYADDYIARVSVGQQLLIPIGCPSGDTKSFDRIIDSLVRHYESPRWRAGRCSVGAQLHLQLTPR